MSRPVNRYKAFIDYVINRSKNDNKFSSEIRRASNPTFEAGGWETLVQFNISLDFKHTRRAYLIMAAAAVQSKIAEDGTIGIGRALALSYAENQSDDQAKARLRRLLACTSLEDVNMVIRPMLTFVQSRKVTNLNYSGILKQLDGYHFDQDKVRAQWATEFYTYGKVTGGDTNGGT